MSKLISAKHVAIREGFTDRREWIRSKSIGLTENGMIAQGWQGEVDGKAVNARIDFGRWLADCPFCGGAEYVDPDDPVFFCLSCGMISNNAKALPVVFPANIDEIEAMLMKRPVKELPYGGVIERALYARPMIAGLGRSWQPGETVADLKKQNKEAGLIDKDQEG